MIDEKRIPNKDLIGFGGARDSGRTAFYIRNKPRMGRKLRPHKIFQNWTTGFTVPWVCFLEIAIMIIYFIVGLFHQEDAVIFTRDFAIGIDDFFLSAMFTDDEGKVPDQVPIYLKNDMVDVVANISRNFFKFVDEFPCANEFRSDNTFNFTLVTASGRVHREVFTEENVSAVEGIVESYIDDLQRLTMTCLYVMRMTVNNLDEELDLRLKADFQVEQTNIITLDFTHNRIPHLPNWYWTNKQDSPFITFPLGIAVGAGLCIIITLYHISAVFRYTKIKAQRNFQRHAAIFWRKIDKWALSSILVHSMSIIASIWYTFEGRDYAASVPVAMVLMAVSCTMHCMLLIRYLCEKETTMLIVNVLYHAITRIAQFLIGCFIICAAYLVFGYCLFGTYNENFDTIIGGARSLIAVIHGDSIQSMFDTAAIRPDISKWAGIIYWAVWVFFSLTIMFNISISIFQDSLVREIIALSQAKARKQEPLDIGRIDQFSFALPLEYKRVF